MIQGRVHRYYTLNLTEVINKGENIKFNIINYIYHNFFVVVLQRISSSPYCENCLFYTCQALINSIVMLKNTGFYLYSYYCCILKYPMKVWKPPPQNQENKFFFVGGGKRYCTHIVYKDLLDKKYDLIWKVNVYKDLWSPIWPCTAFWSVMISCA